LTTQTEAGPDGRGRLAPGGDGSSSVLPSGSCPRHTAALGSLSGVALSSTVRSQGSIQERYVSREAHTSTRTFPVLPARVSLCHEQPFPKWAAIAPRWGFSGPGAGWYPGAGSVGTRQAFGGGGGGFLRPGLCPGGPSPPSGFGLSPVRAGRCPGAGKPATSPRHGGEGWSGPSGAGGPPDGGRMPEEGAGSEGHGSRRLPAACPAANRQRGLAAGARRPRIGPPPSVGRPGLSPVKRWGGLSPTTLSEAGACSTAERCGTMAARSVAA
jgi:hypothetical protein